MLASALLAALTEIQRHAVPPDLRKLIEKLPWLDSAVQNTPRMLVRKLCGAPAADMLHIGRGPLLYWLVNFVALKMQDLRHWNKYVDPKLLTEWFP